ncbi:hypothetical protein BT69DRAFT_347943 [Atractiella rhizophila]|nr:hypothetical protein BT69DRAFT_347943 [Atractiella rhizophila]
MQFPSPTRSRSSSPLHHFTRRSPAPLPLSSYNSKKSKDAVKEKEREREEPHTPPCQGQPLTFGLFGGASFLGKRKLTRNDSFSSIGSLISEEGGEEEDMDEDWTPAEEEVVVQAYENFSEHSKRVGTPFQGLPPIQLTHAVARAILKEEKDWKHSLKATRSKVQLMAKTRSSRLSSQFDPDETPRSGRSTRGKLTPGKHGIWSCEERLGNNFEIGLQATPRFLLLPR